MSNSFNISVSPEIAALDTKIDTIDTVVDSIRATDVPNIQTNINANETKIDTVDTVVDAIKTGTDALPGLIRGHFTLYSARTPSATYVDVCNISGSGRLICVDAACVSADDTFELKITIDSVPSGSVTHTGDTASQSVFFYGGADNSNIFYFTISPGVGLMVPPLNINFDTSLLIQIKRSAGTTADVFSQAVVSLAS